MRLPAEGSQVRRGDSCEVRGGRGEGERKRGEVRDMRLIEGQVRGKIERGG